MLLSRSAPVLAPALAPVHVFAPSPDPPSTKSVQSVLRAALSELSPKAGEVYYNQPQLSREDYAELVTSEPQFWDPTDFPEDPEETLELKSLIPEYLHDFFDIFCRKQGTETLPPHREYNMRIDLKSSSSLAAAKLYQLTEAQ